MPSPIITNSLLRLNEVTGLPPSPFEQPNEKMDFFVLELGIADDVNSWCARTVEALSMHADFLRKIAALGARLTLFVESQSSEPVLRFEASFLNSLAQAGISLEVYMMPPDLAPP
jgi:hypothetical protein